jgi:hypothetical protein
MRTLSATALASAHASDTSEVWLTLLTLTHSSLDVPLRFVNNNVSVTSRGNLFLAFPFEVEFPGEDEESPGEARLTIDNIDRSIVNTIRTIFGPPTVKFEVVLASSLNTVEASFDGLSLRNVTFDATKVTGVLRYEDIVTEPISLNMTPQRFPGMF